MKFVFLFLNLAKIHIFIPKSTEGGRRGGVSTGLGNIPKKTISFLFLGASLIRDGGEGSSLLIKILHSGGLPNLLQYHMGIASQIYYIFLFRGVFKVNCNKTQGILSRSL